MKIVHKKPWFWWIITLIQKEAVWGNVILSLGNVIYSKNKLTDGELAHEKTHLTQDKYSKIIAIINWVRAYFDQKYYLKCEAEAYQAQNKIERNPQLYASYLSSSVYNNIISYEEALKLFL